MAALLAVLLINNGIATCLYRRTRSLCKHVHARGGASHYDVPSSHSRYDDLNRVRRSAALRFPERVRIPDSVCSRAAQSGWTTMDAMSSVGVVVEAEAEVEAAFIVDAFMAAVGGH